MTGKASGTRLLRVGALAFGAAICGFGGFNAHPAMAADQTVKAYVDCVTGAALVNALVRACPYYEQAALRNIARAGVTAGQDVPDARIEPVTCDVPNEVSALSATDSANLDRRIDEARRYNLEELYLSPSLDLAKVSDHQACAALDTAVAKKGAMADYLKEYGFE